MSNRALQQTSAGPTPKATSMVLQRKCACGSHTQGGECADCQRKRMQRRAGPGADEEFQIPPIVDRVLNSPGRPLDADVRARMERGFGQDFSGVRIHHDSSAQASARAVNALAYTVGHNVVFGGGQYSPHSSRGMHLLAHELAHVVQQRGSAGSPGRSARSNAALESAADRAADRVIGGGTAQAIAPAPGPMLARQAVPAESSSARSETQCRGVIRPGDLLRPLPIRIGTPPRRPYSVDRVESIDNNNKRVVLSTGQRYVVTRTPWTRRGTGPVTRADARGGIDASDVWVEFHWCRGATDGRIRAGANVPEQVLQLLRTTIANGGDIEAAWGSASITPTVSGTLRVGTVDITARGQVTIDSGGRATGGEGTAGVDFDIPGGSVGGSITAGSDPSRGGPFVTGNIEIRWGGSPRTPPRCEEEWVRSGFTYSCAEERTVPPETRRGERQVTITDDRAYNLFFNYAVARFDDSRNAEALAALGTDLGAGFQVQSIEGWTSPEGPMAPGPGGFEGNDALSIERANATRDRVSNELCPPNTTCIAPSASVTGRGERMDPVDPVTGERMDVRGAELERHVDTSFATDPGEASVRSPVLMERLRRTPSRRRRAELIYPWLRRAILRLRRVNAPVTEACDYVVPEHPETAGIGNCPDDIRSAAFPDGASRP